MDMPDLRAMEDEHAAWQVAVGEWAKAHDLEPSDINDSRYTPFVRAVEAWGEQLVALRLTQPLREVLRARAEKLELAK